MCYKVMRHIYGRMVFTNQYMKDCFEDFLNPTMKCRLTMKKSHFKKIYGFDSYL